MLLLQYISIISKFIPAAYLQCYNFKLVLLLHRKYCGCYWKDFDSFYVKTELRALSFFVHITAADFLYYVISQFEHIVDDKMINPQLPLIFGHPISPLMG